MTYEGKKAVTLPPRVRRGVYMSQRTTDQLHTLMTVFQENRSTMLTRLINAAFNDLLTDKEREMMPGSE